MGLKHLNLCMNGFGLEGAKALEEALRQNHTLLELNISYCRIPLEGAPHIASGLQHNDCLTHLDVCAKYLYLFETTLKGFYVLFFQIICLLLNDTDVNIYLFPKVAEQNRLVYKIC